MRGSTIIAFIHTCLQTHSWEDQRTVGAELSKPRTRVIQSHYIPLLGMFFAAFGLSHIHRPWSIRPACAYRTIPGGVPEKGRHTSTHITYRQRELPRFFFGPLHQVYTGQPPAHISVIGCAPTFHLLSKGPKQCASVARLWLGVRALGTGGSARKRTTDFHQHYLLTRGNSRFFLAIGTKNLIVR